MCVITRCKAVNSVKTMKEKSKTKNLDKMKGHFILYSQSFKHNCRVISQKLKTYTYTRNEMALKLMRPY